MSLISVAPLITPHVMVACSNIQMRPERRVTQLKTPDTY